MRIVRKITEKFKRRRLPDEADGSKRTFMAAMASAPVAVPAMAHAVATMPTPPVSPHWYGTLLSTAGGTGTDEACEVKAECYPVSIAEQIASYRKDLEELLTSRGDRIRDNLRDTHFHGIDYDLHALRSFSLAAKVRIQAHRQVDMRIESRKSYIEKHIANLLKGDSQVDEICEVPPKRRTYG